jgi:hypothetical protein
MTDTNLPPSTPAPAASTTPAPAPDPRVADLEAAVTSTVKSRMATLTDAQRSAVVAVAGDDPARQLKTIEALAATWTATTAPRDSAPGPSMPRDGAVVGSAPTSRETFEQLRASNPVLAARYAFANGVFEK